MIILTAGSHGMWYAGGGWSLCTMTSVWFARQLGHYRCLFCLIDWLTDVCQADDVDSTVNGKVTFGAWWLWCHKFCHLFGPPREHTLHCLLHNQVITCHPTSAIGLVQCRAANCRHTVYDVPGPVGIDVCRQVLPGKMGETWHHTRYRMGFQLQSSLRTMNRTFSFAIFITARTTLCVIWYDHLVTKLGPDVEELKFNQRLWTLISNAWICTPWSVNRTSIHIPNINEKRKTPVTPIVWVVLHSCGHASLTAAACMHQSCQWPTTMRWWQTNKQCHLHNLHNYHKLHYSFRNDSPTVSSLVLQLNNTKETKTETRLYNYNFTRCLSA